MTMYLPYFERCSAFRLMLLAGLIISSSACGKKVPTGQVVAVVDGKEITRRDLASEPQSSLASGEDIDQSTMTAMLSGVIDRKLAAAEAKKLELDRTPQYMQQLQRLDEVMLSRTLFDRWAAERPQPDQRKISDYIAKNPQRFDGRKLFLVDRIQTGPNASEKSALAPLTTNDAIAAYLDAHSRLYRRSRVVLDSATLPIALYRRLLALPVGSPVASIENDGLNILAVVETRDAPLPAADRSAEAVKALKQLQVQRKLAMLRRKASIAYQPGYRPSAPSSAPSQGQSSNAR